MFDFVIGFCLSGGPQNVLLEQQTVVAFKLSRSFHREVSPEKSSASGLCAAGVSGVDHPPAFVCRTQAVAVL